MTIHRFECDFRTRSAIARLRRWRARALMLMLFLGASIIGDSYLQRQHAALLVQP